MIEGLDALKLPDSGVRIEPYWEHARAGRLALPRCAACGRLHWYPRAMCPFCLSDDIHWEESRGRGTIYSFSIMRTKSPYVVAYVRIDEGITLMTNIVDCDVESLQIGQAVSVKFEKRSSVLVPVFSPV